MGQVHLMSMLSDGLQRAVQLAWGWGITTRMALVQRREVQPHGGVGGIRETYLKWGRTPAQPCRIGDMVMRFHLAWLAMGAARRGIFEAGTQIVLWAEV